MGESLDQIPRLFRGTVIGDDQLEIPEVLLGVTPKDLFQPFHLVVGGHNDRSQHDQSRSERTAKKASWGISTEPTCFIRRLPSFCFSNSFRFRVMSPP